MPADPTPARTRIMGSMCGGDVPPGRDEPERSICV